MGKTENFTGERSNKFFFNGKRVREKVFRNKCRLKEEGKKLQSMPVTKRNEKVVSNLKEKGNISKIFEVEGRRIVHIKTLGEQMICEKCNAVLSLLDINDEKRSGLASTFYIKCRLCEVLNCVSTDKQHKVVNQKNHFDTNTKAVIGTLNNGMGNTHLN
ncbi:uncharacterized protein LOC122506382 [Leptopilina heterotoma]|uniref:uncharacterized protein LOC122506382 n=1 Tax=Leptopilina heterotoma TaxID=63436 RepID=UPI001CA8BB72|nr:uncharacterized protein LOC122506382 [Leptopilina heterotoma]